MNILLILLIPIILFSIITLFSLTKMASIADSALDEMKLKSDNKLRGGIDEAKQTMELEEEENGK